ncbi:hypothetical protein Q8A73_004837 [Channa argus]|nr:hypothetical protein Q8A73_004837 [Channa argus]
MPLRKRQGSASWDLIVQPSYGLTALASINNNTPPLALFAGVSAANVLALQALLLMKVLWLDSGEVESRLDSINPACVKITVPPCQQVSERESVREEKEGRGGGRGGGAGGGNDEEKKSAGAIQLHCGDNWDRLDPSNPTSHPPSLTGSHPSQRQTASEASGMCAVFGETEPLRSSGVLKSNPGGE